ncbi:type II toxin-antitoxin system RelE/ParE family toxin [Curvibacter sp. CHRR-16]|uniref:type II toxin-antitoxin system RelE family toxin n=1 Tax=Curvibacter sp. CHRR-16 TaxID=2835872 RepID=UPI001BD9AEB5|nr:type II toxin-antitoxin system RelE/ParE family toxin [Curvibacter sp. CHRR-16]
MWTLIFEDSASEVFRKLDKPVQRRIKKYLEGVSKLPDPSARGKPLTANFAGYWRYRVGDYRLICRIEQNKLIITVVMLGHRSTLYDA